ncbi:MAG TPA: hypothetical protein VGF45_23850 [Polyangia bacterium]
MSSKIRLWTVGLVAVGFGLLFVLFLRPKPRPAAAPEMPAPAAAASGDGTTVPLPEEAAIAPVGTPELPPPAGAPTVDERARAVLEAGLAKPEGKPPAGDSTALNKFMATHAQSEKELLATLGRAGEKAPNLEGLFALRRRRASEKEMKDYARTNVRGIAARAIVFKWIDQQVGKAPVSLPPPGSRRSADLGTLEQTGKTR